MIGEVYILVKETAAVADISSTGANVSKFR